MRNGEGGVNYLGSDSSTRPCGHSWDLMASKDSAVFKAGQGLSLLFSLPAPPVLGGDTEEKIIFHAHADTRTHRLSFLEKLVLLSEGRHGKRCKLKQI